jgi:hypothetical protein
MSWGGLSQLRSAGRRVTRPGAWLARVLREQAAHETQAELNRRLAAFDRPGATRVVAHICAPAPATLPATHRDDPLEHLWRMPVRRPHRA